MKDLWSYPHVNKNSYTLEGGSNFEGIAGMYHYRLMAYLSSLFNGVTIADVGTSSGGSAFALAANPSNRVYSLDRVNCRQNDPTEVGNVRFVVDDFYKPEIMDEVTKASLISLDIQHEGPDEIYFYKELISRNWKGVLILDDIHLNRAMIDFWNSITHPKYDITEYGHGDNKSGTGIVSFLDRLELEFEDKTIIL